MSGLNFQTLQLKNGSSVNCNQLNIIVGANNSGKTTLLKDIVKVLSDKGNADSILLGEIDFDYSVLLKNAESLFEKTDDMHTADHYLLKAIKSDLSSSEDLRIGGRTYDSFFDGDPNVDETKKKSIKKQFGRFLTTILSAETRLQITKKTPTNDKRISSPANLLQAFYASPKKNEIEKQLKEAFKETFGKDLIFDYSALQSMCFQVGNCAKKPPADPHKLGEFVRVNNFKNLDEEGDGYRSFVGAILAILTAAPRVLLLDEPEAFLHPLQAENLGKLIARISRENNQQVFVATHSSSFLWGALKENQSANIIKINRLGHTPEIKNIQQDVLEEVFKRPVFASQRVLDSLFYNGVIVCEGDSDRAVYDYAITKHLGTTELLVMHAHNKQSGRLVSSFVRKLGTKCAAIFDVDALNDSTEFEKVIASFDAEEKQTNWLASRQTLADMVDQEGVLIPFETVKNHCDETLDKCKNEHLSHTEVRQLSNKLKGISKGWDEVKKKGINYWSGSDKETASNLIDECKRFGIFINPVGELEQWIPSIEAKKSRFVEPALNVIQNNKTPQPLIKFLTEISSFFNDI